MSSGQARARATRSRFSMQGAVALLIGAVLVPTVLSISAGIVSLALWQDASDIVIGVLVISFAAMVVGGTIGTIVLLRKYQRLASLQADFMANISHELNTPLTSIRLFVETLRLGRAASEEEVRLCLDALATETERLSWQIERILKARRLEAGGEPLQRRPEPLAEIVDEALASVSGLARSQSCQLDLQVEAPLPAVLGDRRALGEALGNIIHNAVKYGPVGGCAQIRLRPGEGGKQVLVEVTDHGQGIPANERKRVFDRFFRGEATRRDASLQGTGLGLSIARQIVGAHAGRIELESAVGLGTRVTVFLPAAPGAPPAEPADPGVSRTASLLRGEPAPAPAPAGVAPAASPATPSPDAGEVG
ncbi:MAG: HAMP domain-containing sensor histidine kinase [Myxococcota bacterium]|jgi:two-component system phosphate regulon sensor histidine kinase PhoR|nr:HAMP domain-containing sensor histidine kinase [Myxococcota bacterium]